MSALTFEILSTELTLALSAQSDTPPDTTARCNLGRDKVMVLVEYPLDSAQAEPTASQTLDWLETHLRNQFDTTGLPEEAADLAEAGEEVPVQLFLKHRSEPKPFTMRSFIWKVDDGFDDIFGQPLEAAKAMPPQVTSSQSASEAAENTPIFRHPSEVLVRSQSTHSSQSQASDQNQDSPLDEEPAVPESALTSAMSPTSETAISDLTTSDLFASEPHSAEFRDSELSEPVPLELDGEHLLLDLEPDLELDLDPNLGHGFETGLGIETEQVTGTDSTELDFENYLDTPAPNQTDPSSGLDEALALEAEFSPVSPSTVSPSAELDDLAAGLTYPPAPPSPRMVDIGAAFDADLAAGVTSNRFSESASTEFSLPGEAPEITSSEFDLPTVELPTTSSAHETNTSGDFFTFDQSDADDTPMSLQRGSEELEEEIAFSQVTPTLGDDLSVEFGLSPEEAPPAVYEAGPSEAGPSEAGPSEAGPSEAGLSEAGLSEAGWHDVGLSNTPENESQVDEPQVDEPQVDEPQGADSGTDEDELHLFDLPTPDKSLDKSLSDFDLPAETPTIESSNQVSSPETIEDYLSTEELPSDDLSSEDLPPEEPDSIDAYNLFDDPLMAEVETASSEADDAGPPSLDLSPLAYHILADESDDEETKLRSRTTHQRDRSSDYALGSDYALEGEAETHGADGYDLTGFDREDFDREDYDGKDYDGEDYDGEDYENDSTYYLEDDYEDSYEEPLEDVALIDDGEVERQRHQWQQQSKSNPWIFVGALGLVVLGVLGFVFTRPCSFGTRCDRIQTAQAQGDEAIGSLRLDASLESVSTSKKELESAIQSLKPIPVWSPHHEAAQAILPEYENQVDALGLVTQAQEQAYKAAVDSQNPPHSVSTWNGIAEDWLAATQSLEAVPVDSPVRELAERKLLEYRSNRATILVRIDAESKAEVSLRQSQQAATQATNLTKNAGTLQDWEEALAAWESAVDNLSQIPQGTNAHGEAQQILPGYLKQLEDVRDRTEQERSASRELFQAKQLAADAQRAGSEERWTIAAQNWKAARSQLQDIPQGTLSHSEAQALTGLYTSALNQAESNLQIALRFQPVEPEFFAACSTTTAQKCTYSVRGGNVRLDLFQGYDSIIDQSITPPDQRVIVSTNDQYVDQSNQLLRSITLLSTQAQVPIELYDAQGAFLARYRPDLNGFVRDQEG